MKKIVVFILCLALLVAFAGCAQTPEETASPTTEATPSPTISEAPTTEQTPEATTEPEPEETQASVGSGEMKEVQFHNITFMYNDKYEFEQSSDSILKLQYEPPNKAFVQVFYIKKSLPEDQRDIELATVHDAYISGFDDQQMVETDPIEIAGMPSVGTTALVKTENSGWFHYMMFTIPTSDGYITFAYLINSENEPAVDHTDEFTEMIKSVKIT